MQTNTLRLTFKFGRREIGPIGTAARLIGAGVAIALPTLLDEFSRWDLLVGLVGLPLLATAGFEVVRAGYERYVPGGIGSQAGTCTGAACWLIAIILAALIPLAALTPVTGTSLWIWIGGSLVLAAVRGYGGCEILAFPNALTGRRDQVGCIVFTPIDRAEREPAALADPDSERRDQCRSTCGESARSGSQEPGPMSRHRSVELSAEH